MWLCTANMLIKLEFVWLPSTTEGQLLWTTQVVVQMSCPSWSKRMENRKQIQNDPNAPNATVSYSNSGPHWEDIGFAFWHVVAGPLRQIRTTLPTYTPILLKTLIRTWPSKGLCLHSWCSSPILAMEGRSERRRRIVGKHPQRRQCSQHPSSGRGHCAHRTEALSFHGHWDGESEVGAAQRCSKWWFSEDEFENKTRQRVYAISGMGCNMVSSIFFLNDMASFHGFVMICLFAFLGKQQSNAS